ncbi:MAG: hypothetical protein ISR75_01070 [Phycisphaerales bacterium]|nr:hypothetical protein [Planctomycetota bacterium]MBL6997015.1 hypothetical protein [Phycisphaerales bacterium]
MNDGKTVSQCVKNTYESMRVVVAVMLEDGDVPPRPCNQKRDEQLNIRLSTLEKKQLEVDATQGGFASVSDYVRFKSISKSA